jgi:hypothetical protein
LRHCVYIFDLQDVLSRKAMKRFTILTLAPVLTLFAVGCSSPTAMQSTEYDDMYYSSADKTEYVQPTEDVYGKATEQPQYQSQTAADNEVPNPEYSENRNSVIDNYYGDEYYDGRSYDPRNNWYQPNYSFVDPYWGDNYVRNYGYSNYHRTRYADPFYDPFYYDPFFNDPFAYRPFYNRGVSVTVSYSFGWGNYYGRHYNPYYNRYYSPWHSSSYYSPYPYGYYGRQYVYDYPTHNNSRKVQYGPRDSRGGVVTEGGGQRGTRAQRSSEQRAETPAIQGRPARTTERVTQPASENESRETRRVVTTRPGAMEQYRSTRPEPTERERTTRDQQQRQPYTPPAREYRRQERPTPTQQQRPVQTRQRTPVRETSAPEKREIRRSEPAREPAKSNTNESRSNSGRPPRGQ